MQFVTPTTPDDVADVYESLGTCHDSTLSRGLESRAHALPTSLWLAPDNAPAGLVRMRRADGKWSTAMTVNELGLVGISSNIHATSPDDPCLAVERLFSPHMPAGTNRSEYLHALLYLDEGTHPYNAFPPGGVEPRRADAPIALTSYLNAVSAVREIAGGGVVFSDSVSQDLPMYMSCEKPFQIQTETLFVTDRDIATLDRSLCDGGTTGSDGHTTYRCVVEHAVNPESNTCKFVVDGASLVMDGRAQPVAFGGTITATGGTYSLRVDRFSSLR